MEVHHKRYPRSKNPWDVDDADLITLCSKCHKLEHQKFK
ncbi:MULTISPECIES: HNH endonuclease [Phocaeicola]|nr:HNH endonuclease [Phocaeicola dorei]